jgi:hypothetical protein
MIQAMASTKKLSKTNKLNKTNLKKLNFKKNWKKLSYLGFAGFLAISSVGYGGWKFYEQESASASGWTRILYAHAVQVYICRDMTKMADTAQILVVSSNPNTTYLKGIPGYAYYTIPRYGRVKIPHPMPFKQDIISLGIGTSLSGISVQNQVSGSVSIKSIQICP